MRYIANDDGEIRHADFHVGEHFTQWDWAAEMCAADFHDHHDGWECSWPLEIELVDEGRTFLVEAEEHILFSASEFSK